MNFFGHAALAASHFAAQSPAPQPRDFALSCLGAMLPDFQSMLRLAKPDVRDPAVARGVSFHHRTDHAFHDLGAFHRLSRDAFAWLSERGMPRGPARAVAHVGVEILLDELLAEEAGARDAYRAALAVPLSGALRYATLSDLQRLESLRLTLLERAASHRTPTPELVAQRIRRTLAGRPRLATDDAGELLLGAWVSLARPLVAGAAPELLAVLRGQLADQAPAE